MTITPDQFKEIMRLFDAGDFESRKKAVSMLYEGFSRHYLIVIKRDFMFNKYDDAMAEEVSAGCLFKFTYKTNQTFLSICNQCLVKKLCV